MSQSEEIDVMNRRQFVQSIGAATGLASSVYARAPDTSPTLQPWEPGTLDIHHLAYGRGNSSFILCPDGTTILIDAGTTRDSLAISCLQRSHPDIRPGEWIACYVLRHMKAAQRRELDYALITHFHPDHLGDPGTLDPLSSKGNYRLAGITDVDFRVPIGKLIDRGFPGYEYPVPMEAPFAQNYLEYVKSRTKRGEPTERARVGSDRQLQLVRRRDSYPDFALRVLAANGEVWTGTGEQIRQCFPALRDLSKPDYPTENMCSIAIRLSYGKFDYFTGGDLTADTEELGEPWRDIETPVSRAAGPVEVAVANHHAYFDAVGPNFIRLLRPQIFIVPAWYVAHPAALPLRRMLSQHLYPDNRDIFATCVMEANRAVNNQFVSKLKSLEGNIIVRVTRGGEEFRVIVTDNADDSDRVKIVSGPYRCK